MSDPADPVVEPHFVERQNMPELRRLLMARFRLYDIAAHWQIAQLLVVVLLPIAGAVFALLSPEYRSAVGALAVCITLLDVAVIDRNYRQAIIRAARGAELFDISLFGLRWNALAAGQQLSPEEIERHYRARLRNKGEDDSFNWYPAEVARAPRSIARIICQRANVSYDSALRRHYARFLVITVFVLAAAICIFGLRNSVTLTDVVVTALVPPAPILIWALREYFRQKDAADANDTIQKESEAVLNEVVAGDCDEPQCESRSIQLQAALFARRAANPLLFPGLYAARRSSLEGEMDAGAEYWLAKAGYPAPSAG